MVHDEHRRLGHRRRLAWLGVALCAVGATASFILYRQIVQSDAQLFRESTVADARVVAKTGLGRFRFDELEYSVAGSTYRGRVSCTLCYKEGDHVTVFVDKDDPTRFVTADGGSSLAPWPGLLSGGFIVLGIATAVGTFVLLLRKLTRS